MLGPRHVSSLVLDSRANSNSQSTRHVIGGPHVRHYWSNRPHGKRYCRPLGVTKAYCSAIGRSRERLRVVEAKGAEAYVCDLADTDELTRAFYGALAVYVMIPPTNESPDFATASRNSSAIRWPPQSRRQG